jgi:hypothetical protein
MCASNRSRLAFVSFLALAGVACLSGCNTGDTSAPSSVVPATKAQIQQQIADLQANAKIPAGVKSMAMQNLKQQLANAH